MRKGNRSESRSDVPEADPEFWKRANELFPPGFSHEPDKSSSAEPDADSLKNKTASAELIKRIPGN